MKNKVKRIGEFLNENKGNPMSMKDIIDGPDEKNYFNDEEKGILAKLGFEYSGDGNYYNKKRGVHVSKNDSTGIHKYSVAFSHDNYGRNKASFMGVLVELGQEAVKLATKQVIKEAGNKGIENFDREDLLFFKTLGFEPLGYFGNMVDPKTKMQVKKTEDGRYYIVAHIGGNKGWASKPDGYNLAEFIYDLHSTVIEKYKKQIIKYLSVTKDKSTENSIVDKYLWRYNMDGWAKKSEDEVNKWIEGLVLSDYGKEEMRLGIDADRLTGA